MDDKTAKRLGLELRTSQEAVTIHCCIPETQFDLCPINLRNRLEEINRLFDLSTEKDPFKPWALALVKTHLHDDLCLCGHVIRESHDLTLTTRGRDIRVTLGSKCIERFLGSLSGVTKENVRNIVRKTTDCNRCGRLRVHKDTPCPCNSKPHCKVCDKVIPTNGGNFCNKCLITKTCKVCGKDFMVKGCIAWITVKCEACQAG